MKSVYEFLTKHTTTVVSLAFTIIALVLITSGANDDNLADISSWLYFFALTTPMAAIVFGYRRKK